MIFQGQGPWSFLPAILARHDDSPHSQAFLNNAHPALASAAPRDDSKPSCQIEPRPGCPVSVNRSVRDEHCERSAPQVPPTFVRIPPLVLPRPRSTNSPIRPRAWTTPSEPSVDQWPAPDLYRVPGIGGVQGFTGPLNTGSSSGSRPASGTPQNLSNQHRWSGQGHYPHRVRSTCINSRHYTESMGRPGR